MPENAKPIRDLPVYRRVAAQVRERLTQQQPGDLLAPELDLAREFDVSRYTMREALDVLVQEGLIRRYRRRGTVVVDRHAVGEFAVVMWPRLFHSAASPFFSMLSTAIGAALGTCNPRWNTRLCLGKMEQSADEYVRTLGLLEPDVLRRLRGVFSFHPLGTLASKLRAARVPIVYLLAGHSGSISLDSQLIPSLGLAHLREVGCRQIGALLLWGQEEFLERAAEYYCRAGRFRLLRDWVVVSPETPWVEQWGYETFCRLWKQKSRPDGILVADDIACRGVLRAILHLGVKLPSQLRLVSHTNRGIPLPYHQEVTRVEFDPAQQARLVVEAMVGLLRSPDSTPPTLALPPVLIKGETT